MLSRALGHFLPQNIPVTIMGVGAGIGAEGLGAAAVLEARVEAAGCSPARKRKMSSFKIRPSFPDP